MPEPVRFWHVTVTLAGDGQDASTVKESLTRLADQHAFLHSMRYSATRAEISYWEEAGQMLDAAALALRVWHEHRRSAGLPEWEVVGLEILERGMYGSRHDQRLLVGLRADRAEPTPF